MIVTLRQPDGTDDGHRGRIRSGSPEEGRSNPEHGTAEGTEDDSVDGNE